MKPAFSDAEAPAIYNERLERFDRLWRAGQIGDSTYLRSLFIDGVDTSDAVSRLNMLRRERQCGSRPNPNNSMRLRRAWR